MKKIFVTIATLCASCAPLQAFSFDDVKNGLYDAGEKVIRMLLGFMQYLFPGIFPAQEGIKAHLIAAYIGMRIFIGKLFGVPPQSVYEYVVERAKNNPLEAIGALTIIFGTLWMLYLVYRLVYRFYYWLLINVHVK